MRLTKSIATLAAAFGALTFAQTAIAQDEAGSGSVPDLEGDVVSTTGDTGSVVVERQGNLYSLSEGDDLFEGDIVQTTSNGSTTLNFTAADGTPCTVTLTASQIFAVTGASCSAPPPVAMTSTQIAALEGTAVAGTAGSGVGAAVFGIPAALGAVGVAAAAGGDDDGTPASPG